MNFKPVVLLMLNHSSCVQVWLICLCVCVSPALNIKLRWSQKWGRRLPAGAQEKRRAGYGDLDDVLAALTLHLEKHDYIADGRFTAADVYVGSQVGWGMQFGGIPKTEVLSAYWARLKDRPALLAANAKDNALIPEVKP